jgi:hypothetical protein
MLASFVSQLLLADVLGSLLRNRLCHIFKLRHSLENRNSENLFFIWIRAGAGTMSGCQLQPAPAEAGADMIKEHLDTSFRLYRAEFIAKKS